VRRAIEPNLAVFRHDPVFLDIARVFFAGDHAPIRSIEAALELNRRGAARKIYADREAVALADKQRIGRIGAAVKVLETLFRAINDPPKSETPPGLEIGRRLTQTNSKAGIRRPSIDEVNFRRCQRLVHRGSPCQVVRLI
tara:strand:- start:213 stop:632 length:420 start_codon:yes stop_codon:yes gene_type:complete